MMKTLFSFFAIVMVFFAGCAKDYTSDESLSSVELKKAKVAIPFKADLCAVPDMDSEPIFLPVPGFDPSNPAHYCKKKMIISGNGTHLGRVDGSGTSYYEVEGTEFMVEDSKPLLFQYGTGILVAANGDSFEFTWWVKSYLPEQIWAGEFEITPGSGTGKFQGISGILPSNGQANSVEHINCWTSEGFIEFE
ncbi:MAG TPA: hypothetical protein PLM34_12280 [Lentimicrobium sp.]|nr:hypothetical protein [Lentimicrobium sp.]